MLKFLLALYASFVVFSCLLVFFSGYELSFVAVVFVVEVAPFALGVAVGRGERCKFYP